MALGNSCEHHLLTVLPGTGVTSLVSKPGFWVDRDHSLVIFIFLSVLTKVWSLSTWALIHCKKKYPSGLRKCRISMLGIQNGEGEKGEWLMCELVAVGWQRDACTD